MAEANRTVGVLGLPDVAQAFAESGVTVLDHTELRGLNAELKATEKDRKSAPVGLLVCDDKQTSIRAWLAQKVNAGFPVGIFRIENGPGLEVAGAVDIAPNTTVGDVARLLGIAGPLARESDVIDFTGSITGASSAVPAPLVDVFAGFDEAPAPVVNDDFDELPAAAPAGVPAAVISPSAPPAQPTVAEYDPWEDQASDKVPATVTSVRPSFQVPATPAATVDPWEEVEKERAREASAATAQVRLPEAVEAQLADISQGAAPLIESVPTTPVPEAIDPAIKDVTAPDGPEVARPVRPIEVPEVEAQDFFAPLDISPATQPSAPAPPLEQVVAAAVPADDDDDDDDFDIWDEEGELEEFGEEPATPIQPAPAIYQAPAPVEPAPVAYQAPVPVQPVPMYQAPTPVEPAPPVHVEPAPVYQAPAPVEPARPEPIIYQAPAPVHLDKSPAAPVRPEPERPGTAFVRPGGEVAIRPRGTIVRNAARPCIITIGAKGGIGKTSMTLLMAQYAASKGLSVAVVDANRGQGDMRTLLRLRDAGLPTIRHLAMGGAVREVILNPDTINDNRDTSNTGGIDFALVQAPEGDRDSASMVSARHYAAVLTELRTRADLTIVDTQIVEAEDTSELFDDLVIPTLATDANAYCLAVTDSAITSINNTVDRMDAFLGQQISQEKIMVVLNRVTEHEEPRVNKMLALLGSIGKPMGMIPNEVLVKDALDRGIIPDVSNIESLALVFDRIIFHATGDERFAPPAQEPEGRTARRKIRALSFFSRR